MASHHIAFYLLYVKYFNIDLLSYSVFETIIGMLFYINPLIGYFSDRVKLFGSKKKMHLVFLGLITALSFAMCANSAPWGLSVGVIFFLNVLVEVMNSFRTVLIDSFCVIVHNIEALLIKDKAPSSTSSVSALFFCRLTGKILSTVIMLVFYNHTGMHCKLNSLLHFERSRTFRDYRCFLSD